MLFITNLYMITAKLNLKKNIKEKYESHCYQFQFKISLVMKTHDAFFLKE